MEPFEEYFKKMQGIVDVIVQDPSFVNLDAFAEERLKFTKPDRSLFEMEVLAN